MCECRDNLYREGEKLKQRITCLAQDQIIKESSDMHIHAFCKIRLCSSVVIRNGIDRPSAYWKEENRMNPAETMQQKGSCEEKDTRNCGMLCVQFEGNVDARNKGDAAIERKMMMSMVFVSNPSLHF